MISIFVAAAAAYGFGAVWYMIMAEPWMEATGLDAGLNGGKQNRTPFIISAIAVILVAGMMRHVLVASGMSGFGGGLMVGAGLGLLIATPWIATNNAFAMRPVKLTLIDGTYATVGCTLIGVVLGVLGT